METKRSLAALLLCILSPLACGGSPPMPSGGGGGQSGSSGGDTPGAGGDSSGGGSSQGGPGGAASMPTDNHLSAPSQEISLQVSPGTDARPISRTIYGINGAASAPKAHATLVRLGGHRASSYNWEINAANGGRPEGYSNVPASDSADPGAAAREAMQAAAASGGAALIGVPIGDYVAADRTPGDVQSSGSSMLSTRFKKNKAAKKASLLSTPDTSDDSVYQDEFASWLKANAAGTPLILQLDNEPELWVEDHAEIHPEPATYDEVVQRNADFARALKDVWPEAPVTGFVSYGWLGYHNLQNSPEGLTKGEFVTYYLAQMQAIEKAEGRRLVDYLDLHWWPEAQGGGVRVTGPETTPEVVEARLQAPRSLWDETYRETSWINEILVESGDNITLIPKMHDRIAQNYPGTKLAFSAWYYGGGGDISGALATADVLGIFGREGVDLAAIELPGGGVDDSFTLAAFQAFLNFDGAGAHFGDTSVRATSSDVAGLTAYASVDSSDPTRLVIVAINKYPADAKVNLTIQGGASYASASRFSLTAAGASLKPDPAVAASGANAFSFVMPARSLSVLLAHP